MRLGVIGGTGLIQLEDLTFLTSEGYQILSDDNIIAETEYGNVPLRCISISKDEAPSEIIFLQRHHHGDGGSTPPHMINHKANVMALKGSGLDSVVSICSVGTLTQDLPPGRIGYADQYIDFTGVATSFFDDDARFTSVTTPFDTTLNSKISESLRSSQSLNSDIKLNFCYYLAQGPQFETAAEIKAINSLGGEVVGMTMPREAKLCREISLPYSAIVISSNWAAGMEPGNPSADLSHEEVSSQANSKLRPVLDCLASLL